MTDNLQHKFTDVEQLLSLQHDELMAKLDDLAGLLPGAPIPGSATLGDVVNAINALTTAIGEMAAQQLTFYNSNLEALSTINTSLAPLADIQTAIEAANTTITTIQSDNSAFFSSNLDALALIGTNTETIIQNNSINLQYLLRAIAAIDPCKPCDTPAYTLPPIGITPTTINTEHCKRMQALLYALERFTVKLDVLSSFGVGFSTTVITDAFNEVISEINNPTTVLLPSALEIANLITFIVAYVASNFFEQNSLVASFQTLHDTLLTVLYDTDTADTGKAAYKSTISASELSNPIKNLLIAIGYTSLFNLYYDQSQELNLAGYDGTICAPESTNCQTFYDGTWGVEHFTSLHADPDTYVHARATNTGLLLTITRPNQSNQEVQSPFDDEYPAPDGGTFEFMEVGGSGGELFYEVCQAS